MTVIGLVVEGTNDFPILSAVVEACLNERFDRPLKFKYLQPEPDATSGGFSGGGWSRVLGWCRSYSGSNLETFFSKVEEDDEVCDLIIVHLDGDAMEPCAIHYTGDIPSTGCSPLIRVETLKKMVTEWLQPPADHACQLKMAFPTMHTESWVMEKLAPQNDSWEVQADAKTPFLALKRAREQTALYYKRISRDIADLADHGARNVSFCIFRADLQE